MQCHTAQQRGIPVDDLDGETGPVQIAPDLDHPGDADRGRSLDHGSQVGGFLTVARHVQMGVVVDDRDRQRVRGGRPAAAFAHAESPSSAGRSRASSSSTTDGSSLVKIGKGLGIRVPTLIGRDSQRGVPV